MKLNRNVLSLVVLCVLTVFVSAGYTDQCAGYTDQCAGYKKGCGYQKKGGYGGYHSKGLSEKAMKKMHIVLRSKKELELTDEQEQAIRKLKADTKKKVITMKADVDIIVVDIKELMRDDPMDTEAINTLIDKKYDIKKTKAKILIGTYAELNKILNEDQKAKLCDLYSGKVCKK